ncbi:MAG: amidohydrolase [Gemmatimonadetes bacterium]|nr:amidohydrolase [Gemmatimonadota bacterium]
MSKYTRKDFLGLGALVAGSLGAKQLSALEAPMGNASPSAPLGSPLPPMRQRGAGVVADTIVVNARVLTQDAAQPRAEAIAIREGRFLAVGSNADIRNLANASTKVIDAARMTVVPGFIDTHNHAGGTTLLYEVLVGNPFEVEFVTIQSIIDKLKAKAQQSPPGTWIEGYFHDDTKLKDKRPLNTSDLDKVSTEHPVVVRHRGGHTSFYNSKAFAMAGITKNTPNVPGGTYDKDASGELNGRVTDRATAPFNRVGTRAQYTPEQRAQRDRDGIAHISKEFARYGLTSVHHEGGDLAAIQDVRARGDLLHRVSYEAQGGMVDTMIANGIKTGFGDEWVRFGATSEHSVDGSFSERTMALSTPYPGQNGYKGNVTETQDVLDAWVEKVHRAGIQVNIHANGDVAIDSYLTAVERAQKAFPRKDFRPKITHCTLINDDLIRRIKALDAIPACFTTYAYYNTDKFPFYGEDLMKRSMAFRSMLDAGIHAAAGSDFSPGPFAPLMGIQGMVTRRGWDGTTWGLNQRVSVDEAIRINTLNGAYASFEENIKGTITAGKLADFVILDRDPHDGDPNTIKDVKIVRTVTGGRTVYGG